MATLITPHHNYNCDCNYNYTTLIALHCNYNSTTLQLQVQLHYNALHPAVVGEDSEKHNSNHFSVHQWIRSAIHASQQLTSPIVSYPIFEDSATADRAVLVWRYPWATAGTGLQDRSVGVFVFVHFLYFTRDRARDTLKSVTRDKINLPNECFTHSPSAGSDGSTSCCVNRELPWWSVISLAFRCSHCSSQMFHFS